MAANELFRLGATTPPNSFAHASAYVQASAQVGVSTRRGIDLTAGFDLQGKVEAGAGASGVGASFAAGVDVSGTLAVQAALPIDLFSAEGAGLIARLQAQLAVTAFASAALSLDRAVLEGEVRAKFGEPMSSLLDIVLEELDIEAGLWGRASLAIEAIGEAALAGTLLSSADNGAGLTFEIGFDAALGYGAGVHFLANLGFPQPQRLFTRLAGVVSDQLLALVTPSDPDESDAVSVSLGALQTLLPVALRGVFQLGAALIGDPSGHQQAATAALASSLVAQGQQLVLQAVTDLATGLLGDALSDARLVSALSRITADQLTQVTAQLTTLQTGIGGLAETAVSDIDAWLTGLLGCLGTVEDLLSLLTQFGVPDEVSGNAASSVAMLWAAGTLLQRVISWADDATPGSPFGSDAVTPAPAASVAAEVKPAGGTLAYADVAAYLIGCEVVQSDLETALRAAVPQAAAAFDWLTGVLQIGPGQLVQALFQELAGPTDQEGAALVAQLTTAAADAVTNHILPELIEPLATAGAGNLGLSAFVEDVIKPALVALAQVILPAVAQLGTDTADDTAGTRLREVLSAVLLHTVEHFVTASLQSLLDHALSGAEAALNQAAADVAAAGEASQVVRDIEAVAGALTFSPVVLLLPTPGDVVNILQLSATVAGDIKLMTDNLLALVDMLTQCGLGADSTRLPSLRTLAGSDQPVDASELAQALGKVGDGALTTIGDVLSDIPKLVLDHIVNEVVQIVDVIEKAAAAVVQALQQGIVAIEQGITDLGQLIAGLGQQIGAALGKLGDDIYAFGQYVQTMIPQAMEGLREAGLQVIYSLMGGPPHSLVQQAIVDLYNSLFDALSMLADLLAGVLGAAAEALGDILSAGAAGSHFTADTADAAVRQGLFAASTTDLNFDLKVTAFGVTLLDLGTITISAGSIAGLLHDLFGGDATCQSTMQSGVQHASQTAALRSQQAAAQIQDAAQSTDVGNLQATVASMTLPAPPAAQILAPAAGAALPFGARVLITVSGVNSTFTGPIPGLAPRIVIRVNGSPWSYQSSDWSQYDPTTESGTLVLQAVLVAASLPDIAPPAGSALSAQSITTSPDVTAVFAPQIGQVQLQQVAPPPLGTPIGLPEAVDLSGQAWVHRAILRQALASPDGTLRGTLAGQGRVVVQQIVAPGSPPPFTMPPAWVLFGPPVDPLISKSTPAMVGKFGINTIQVAVADGSGHDASATTTVVIHPGPPLLAVSAQHSGSCVTVAGGETAIAAGIGAQQSSWLGGRNQMWSLSNTQSAGDYWLNADHSGLALGVANGVPVQDSDGWRLCSKCQGLYEVNPNTQPPCAGGGMHDPAGSADYQLGWGIFGYWWDACMKCQCLISTFNSPGVCPAGGGHREPDDETGYGPNASAPPPPGSPSWQWCGKCAMLVPAGGLTGVCPAGGGHDTANSSSLELLVNAADGADGTPLAQGLDSAWQFLPGTDSRYHRIQRSDTGKVAEVAGASTADGAVIDQWDWLGNENQQWRLSPVAEIDPSAYYTVTAMHSGKVLEVTGGPAATADGAGVDQWSGTGQPNQRWRFLPNADGSYAIVAEHSGSGLLLPGASAADGVLIQQWHSVGLPAEDWLLVPTVPGYYKIQSGLTGKVLDVEGGSTADGAPVHQWTWVGGANQQWSLSMVADLDPDAWYTITARHSGLSLGVAGGPTAIQDGAVVEQSLAANSANQRWRLEPVGGGAYVLVPQHTTLFPDVQSCLDVAGGSTADGAAVQQRTQNGGTSQRWQIMPAEPGCYKIQNEASGRVLQVTGGPSAVAPATPVQQWDWIGGDNQMWRLTR
jgi:hypothetical protein